MPLTVFDCQGIPADRRDRIEAAVEAAGQTLTRPYAAWISRDLFSGGARVTISGPDGFDRTVYFGLDEELSTIRERVRQTLEEL